MTGGLPMRPGVASAREYGRHGAGKLTVVFYDDIVSVGPIRYAYIAAIFRDGEGDPVLYFTSEENASPIPALLESLGVESGGEGDGEGSGSHFFCAFDVDGHSNYGASDDWADAGKFKRRVIDAVEDGLAGGG